MYIKLDYGKLGVSNVCFSKVIEEKPWGGGGGGSTPLVKERLGLFYGLKSKFANCRSKTITILKIKDSCCYVKLH